MKTTILLTAAISLVLCATSHAKGFGKATSRGFSIPQIDLSDREDLQTVISKHEETYMGHPSSVLLDDGKTMIMAYLDKHGRGNIMWRRSEDAGKTWSEDLPLPDGWGGTLTINGKEHAQFLEVPIMYKIDGTDGVQRIVMYTSGRNIHPARYTVSEDGGKTWSKLKPILAGGKTIDVSIVLFSDMVKLKNGHYLFTYHEPGKVFTTTSPDGITFTKPKLTATYPDAFLCEGGFVRSPDGKQIALLMRENNRNYNSFICFSDDEGKTWSEPRQMPDSLTGDRHQHTYTPDGRLFISFRDRGAGSPTVGDWVGWVGTYKDLVSGAEGQYRVRMKDNFKGNDCAYPSQHILPDGTLFAATYGGWEEGAPNYLIGFHFKIEELDALAEEALPGKTVVFERDETYGYRIPSLVTAKNGDLLAFIERRTGLHDHAKNDIVLRRSTNGGKSWKKLQVIADEGGDSLNDPCATVLDNGDIVLVYQRFPEGVHARKSSHTVMAAKGYGGPENTRSYVTRSSDHGKTWEEPAEITKQIRRKNAISVGGPGRGIQLSHGPHKGRLLIPLYETNRLSENSRDWDNSAAYSDDGGRTWQLGKRIPRGVSPGFGNESQIVELSDGSVLMSSRNQGGGPFRRFSTSSDGGETWTADEAQEGLVTPACMSSILAYDDETLLHSIPFSRKGRSNGAVFLSRDGGKTWPTARLLERGGFAYSCLTRLDDGSIGCLYESNGYKQTLFVRFPMDWLLQNTPRS